MSNLPARVALKAADWRDSQATLGESGAERLLKNGDGLAKIGGELQRFQAPYINDKDPDKPDGRPNEWAALCGSLRQNGTDYDPALTGVARPAAPAEAPEPEAAAPEPAEAKPQKTDQAAASPPPAQKTESQPAPGKAETQKTDQPAPAAAPAQKTDQAASPERPTKPATPPPIPQTAKQVTPSEFATPKSRPLTEYVSDFVKEMQDPAKRAKLSPYHEAVAKHFQSTVAPRSSRFSSGFLKKEAVARGVAVTDLPEDVLKQANESAQQQSAEYIQNATKLADFAQAHGVSPDDFQKAFDKAAEGPADGLTPDKVFPELAQGEPKAKTTPPPPPPPKAKTTPPPIPADAKKTEVKKQPAPGEGGVDWDAIGRDVGMRAGGLARAASRRSRGRSPSAASSRRSGWPSSTRRSGRTRRTPSGSRVCSESSRSPTPRGWCRRTGTTPRWRSGT
jgi:hypothetical protein